MAELKTRKKTLEDRELELMPTQSKVSVRILVLLLSKGIYTTDKGHNGWGKKGGKRKKEGEKD